MMVAMSKDSYDVLRHKLVIQAELARETGDLGEFIECICLYEPAKTVGPMLRLAEAFRTYRYVSTDALAKVSRGGPK